MRSPDFLAVRAVHKEVLLRFHPGGVLAMQRGQNILTEQSIQIVHPAKSHSRKVCPKI